MILGTCGALARSHCPAAAVSGVSTRWAGFVPRPRSPRPGQRRGRQDNPCGADAGLGHGHWGGDARLRSHRRYSARMRSCRGRSRSSARWASRWTKFAVADGLAAALARGRRSKRHPGEQARRAAALVQDVVVLVFNARSARFLESAGCAQLHRPAIGPPAPPAVAARRSASWRPPARPPPRS